MGAVDIFIGEAILTIKMFVIILSSLLAASNSLPFQFPSLSKPSVCVPNPCNTQEGTQCVFPFTYLGVEYYKCTYAASPVPWCATMVDSNGTVVTNKWGDCSNTALSSCPVESIDVPSCVTQGGPQENMPCVFPFQHHLWRGACGWELWILSSILSWGREQYVNNYWFKHNNCNNNCSNNNNSFNNNNNCFNNNICLYNYSLYHILLNNNINNLNHHNDNHYYRFHQTDSQ